MRLRLAPAMAFLAAIAPAAADTRDDILSRASRCAQFTDNRQWLDCYYGAAQPMRALLGLPPASDAQQRLSAGAGTPPAPPAVAPPPAPAPQFGFEERQEMATQISARMTAFNFDAAGFFTATLSNGQVWRQDKGDMSRAPWSKSPDRVVYNVTIVRGALGSFNFKVAGQPGAYKVRRIK